ncbi:hypothetical protein ACFQPG_01535 [Sphingomonas sp. GCM10030256]|uniref:hypothetical protein n=1 Tax=Sphingomonas sp. GCM10030256 TaxID=3273427 RepID=UPI00360A3A9A
MGVILDTKKPAGWRADGKTVVSGRTSIRYQPRHRAAEVPARHHRQAESRLLRGSPFAA